MPKQVHFQVFCKATLALSFYFIVVSCTGQTVPRPTGPDVTPPEEVRLIVKVLNKDGGTNQEADTSNTSSSSPECLSANSNDFLSFYASAKDPQGLKDIQIWISQKICTESGGMGQCSEGVPTEPIAHNPHQGDTSMVSTDRNTLHLIDLKNRDNSTSVRFSATARGINFNNKTTYTKHAIEVHWPPVAGCHAA